MEMEEHVHTHTHTYTHNLNCRQMEKDGYLGGLGLWRK